MKKLFLLLMVAALFIGNVKAQDVEVLLEDDFSAYTVGGKLASEANAAGNDWWSTWGSNPGSSEDGVITELDGNKCAYLEYGNDQILLLGGSQSGVYDLEFDILVPSGSNGYFNVLHKFAGQNSQWAMQAYLHIVSDGGQTDYAQAGYGTIHAGGNAAANFTCVYDEWMHFRLHIDTDTDVAEFYYDKGEGEEFVHEWQWSMDSFGEGVEGRDLDAMNFFPPMNNSEYYLDNFKCTRIGGVTAPELVFTPESIEEELGSNDMTNVTISIENEGSSIGDYSAWIDYGVGAGGSNEEIISYAEEIGSEGPGYVSWTSDKPVTFEIASLFPASAYGNSVMGTYITAASYIVYAWVDQQGNLVPSFEEGSDIIFRIYGQGKNNVPGEVLAEKVIPSSAVVFDEYIVAEFDEPVALTGYDVYVAVEMTSAVDGIVMTLDNAEGVTGYGDLYRQNNGAFQSITNATQDGSTLGNWCINMHCEGEPIVGGGFATLDKTSGSLPIGESDEVVVSLSSIGLAEGTYEATVKFVTNDPANPEVEIPLTLKVGGENVEEMLSNAYNIYPNPTTAQVVVEGENINYIAIYNTTGQLLNVVKNANNIVDMSQYGNGVYYFNIVDNANQSSLQRVVVAK